VFTARYELMPYIKQITISLEEVKHTNTGHNCNNEKTTLHYANYQKLLQGL